MAWDFSEGLASVWKNPEWIYIDKSGKTAFYPKTMAGWGFSDGLTVVGSYSTKVYVDKTGKVIAPYEN